MKKFYILSAIIVIVLLLASWGFSQKVSSEALERVPQYTNMLAQKGILLKYDSVDKENCLLDACLAFQNVRAIVLGQEVPLGDASISFSVLSREDGALRVTPHNASQQGLNMIAQMQDGIIEVSEARFVATDFDMIFNLIYNPAQADMKGTVLTTGLLGFVNQFIPPEMQQFMQFFLTDKTQTLYLETTNRMLKINGISVLPLQPIIF